MMKRMDSKKNIIFIKCDNTNNIAFGLMHVDDKDIVKHINFIAGGYLCALTDDKIKSDSLTTIKLGSLFCSDHQFTSNDR